MLSAGGNPTVQLDADDISETILRTANEEQLAWISPLEKEMAERLDVRISYSRRNQYALVDRHRPTTPADLSRTRGVEFIDKPTCSAPRRATIAGLSRYFPCPACAQEADMSLREYEDFVYGATFADQPDPVQRWQEVHDRQQELVDWLKGKENVHVRGPIH